MTPIHRTGMIVLGQPSDWNTDTNGLCSALPVFRDDCGLCSYWRLSWRERLLVLFGRPVRLHVHGKGHPPVMLDMKR